LQNSIYLAPASSNLEALPRSSVFTGFKSPLRIFSILSSNSLDNFSPSELNILIPLSKKSLWEALITTPNFCLRDRVKYATPGVGNGPHKLTFTPAAIKPA